MSLSTHVLDLTLGAPARGIPITLECLGSGGWELLGESRTDGDGRCADLLPASEPLRPATYRLHFDTAGYFAERGLPSLYPYVEIAFAVQDERHHHIPLLLTANGYTTYRGS